MSDYMSKFTTYASRHAMWWGTHPHLRNKFCGYSLPSATKIVFDSMYPGLAIAESYGFSVNGHCYLFDKDQLAQVNEFLTVDGEPESEKDAMILLAAVAPDFVPEKFFTDAFRAFKVFSGEIKEEIVKKNDGVATSEIVKARAITFGRGFSLVQCPSSGYYVHKLSAQGNHQLVRQDAGRIKSMFSCDCDACNTPKKVTVAVKALELRVDEDKPPTVSVWTPKDHYNERGAPNRDSWLLWIRSKYPECPIVEHILFDCGNETLVRSKQLMQYRDFNISDFTMKLFWYGPKIFDASQSIMSKISNMHEENCFHAVHLPEIISDAFDWRFRYYSDIFN